MPCRPLAEPVDRLAGQEDVANQQENRLRLPDTDAAIFLWQCGLEQLLELHSVKQCIDDRQRAGRRGLERAAPHAGPWRTWIRGVATIGSGWHGGILSHGLCAANPCRIVRQRRVLVHLRATQGNVRSREKTNSESCSPTTYDTAMRRKLCGARLTSKGLDVSETTPRAESRMDIASQPRTATMPLPSGRRSATLIAVADRLHLSRTKLLRLEKRRNHRRDVRKAGYSFD